MQEIPPHLIDAFRLSMLDIDRYIKQSQNKFSVDTHPQSITLDTEDYSLVFKGCLGFSLVSTEYFDRSSK